MRGYFLTPEGQLLWVQATHIETVIADPARFGLSMAEIDAQYALYDEPKPIEGKARGDLLVRILRLAPWVRVRERPRAWELQLCLDHHQAVDQLQTFARLVLQGTQPAMPTPQWAIQAVCVMAEDGRVVWSGTLGQLAEGAARTMA